MARFSRERLCPGIFFFLLAHECVITSEAEKSISPPLPWLPANPDPCFSVRARCRGPFVWRNFPQRPSFTRWRRFCGCHSHLYPGAHGPECGHQTARSTLRLLPQWGLLPAWLPPARALQTYYQARPKWWGRRRGREHWPAFPTLAWGPWIRWNLPSSVHLKNWHIIDI